VRISQQCGESEFRRAAFFEIENKYSFKTVKVGTTGSSITGFREGREVVDPASIEEAIAIQNALKVIAGVSGSS
jgi:hypothetical protein